MPHSPQTADVVVIGAGAAGMMCAFETGRRGRDVTLLDHGERPGRKILISGGGRCNFTNTGTRAEHFISENPHFARSALARYTPADTIALVEKHGIAYHEKTLGQLFCDDSARRIVTLLERECAEAGVRIRCNVRVMGVRAAPPQPSASNRPLRFVVETSAGTFSCRTLVIATGGLSIPKMGATGFGYEVARQFSHRLLEPRPALVPFVLAPEDLADWSDLAGVSTEVIARAEERNDGPATPGADPKRADPKRADHKSVPRTTRGGPSQAPAFREKLLLTHRGLSGPAVLQISSYWQPSAEVSFDLAPGQAVVTTLKSGSAGRDRKALLTAVKRVLPARLAERWVERQTREGNDWTNAGIDRAEAALHNWRVRPSGTEGFSKAEVTAGGVDTRELDARTLESLRVPGLHFIGEVVDVTGWLGGYNFQWAWASAAACGRNL